MSETDGKLSLMLRQALRDANSVRAVARATGLTHPALIRFMRGDQSLRLDLAERLADYFGIEYRMRGKGGRRGKPEL